MVAKTSPQRRAAFFRALAATGNRTLAAERAKVSQSWVTLHRAQDPGFAQAMVEAIAAARERLCADGGIGMSAAAVYAHRKRRQAFAELWDRAVETG